MLRQVEPLIGYKIVAEDDEADKDEAGKVEDCFFDDAEWTVRELVVRTGNWLTGTRIVILPHHVKSIDQREKKIAISLTRKQLEEAPLAPALADELLSRYYETALYDYYNLSYYWVGPYLWGNGSLPQHDNEQMRHQDPEQLARHRESQDSHLRSFNIFNGFDIRAADGAMGDIEDMLFDDTDWRTHHLVVDTRKYLLGRNVLIPPEAVVRVEWDNDTVYLRMTRAEINAQPTIESLSHIDQIMDGKVLNVGKAA